MEFASHLKADFGEIVLKEGNTNIVKDAGEYSFTVCVAETENYAGAEYTVKITVGKATYTEGQIPAQKVAEEDIVAGMNKTLADVALAEGFAWTEDSLGYKAGENTAAAIYCGDTKNYEPYSLPITFKARRENITLFADGSKLEADFGIESFTDFAAALCAKDEQGESFTLVDLSTLCTAAFENVDYATGGTYAVRYTLTTAENDYYAFAFENAGDGEYFAPFKLKSVKLGDALYTIEDALAKAVSGNTVIVTANTAFASADTLSLLNGVYSAEGGHYTVKAGVTLLVPYDTGYSENTKDCDVNYEAVGATPFATLTVSSGVSLSVNGKLIVNAKIVQRSGVTSTVKGNLYGAMNVCADASITLTSGSVYESIGFSYGEGTIYTQKEANVYELFNMVGYKGGTISSGIEGTVFPLNQYGMTSISCKLEIVYAANYYAKAFTAALSNSVKVDADVLFVSDDSSAFLQVMSEKGKIYKWIDESIGAIYFETDGDVQFNNMSVKLGRYALDTAGREIPIPGNFKFIVNSGTVTIPADIRIKLLPGMSLTIKEGAGIEVYGRLYSYGSKDSYSMAMTDGGEPLETWQDGNQSVKAYPLGDMKNVYRKVPTLDYTASSPAVISVAGSINVYAGAYFACEVSGVQNGKLHFDSASELTGTIQEDFSHIEKKWGIINTCIEVYFTTTIKAAGANGEVFEKGKDYTYDGESWTAAPQV